MSSNQRTFQPSTSTSNNPQIRSITQVHLPNYSGIHGSTGQWSPLVLPVMHFSPYPSSTLHRYYPSPPSVQNFVHITSPPLLFSPVQYPLPSASQTHLPTLRGTPTPHSSYQPDTINNPRSPYVQYTSPLLSPLHFPQLNTLNNLTSSPWNA